MERAFLTRALGALALVTLVLLPHTSRGLEPLRLRVVTYNIHHGEGVDGKLDLERIARVLNTERPDLVALQEVDRRAKRTGGVDQPAELARLTKMHVAFGANIPLQGGEYGNALLSRFPIRRFENRRLPRMDQGEQRGVLEAEIELPDGRPALHFWVTHLDHRTKDEERRASVAQINDRVGAIGAAPALLAGDLNDVPGSPTLDALLGTWTNVQSKPQPTIPVEKPERQIDFVLFRPRDRWTVVESRVLDEAVASDHRALLAVVEWWPEPTRAELRTELMKLVEIDQAARRKLLAADPTKPPPEIVHEIQELDQKHTRRLRAIVEEFGWPGRRLVGSDGAHAAWLLVQHADLAADFQADCLKRMEAAPPGDVDSVDLAYLTDRVLVAQKKPQRYGTQLEWIDGQLRPKTLEEPEQVDERRRSRGLQPLAEYLRFAEQMFRQSREK